MRGKLHAYWLLHFCHFLKPTLKIVSDCTYHAFANYLNALIMIQENQFFLSLGST